MKKIITIILAITLCCACFATDIEDVIAKAYQNSPQVEQYERSRQDSLYSNSATDNSFSYTLNMNKSPVSVFYDSNDFYFPSLGADVNYTDNVHKISYSGSLNSDRIKLKTENYDYSVSGSFGITKTFDLKAEDLSGMDRIMRDTNLQISYETNVLNFRKSVLSDVYSIVDLKHTISESEKKLTESQKDYNSKLATGELKEGTTAQIKAKMALDSAVSSLDSQKKSLESKLTAFEKNYGFAYTDVDSASRPVLEFVKNADGNSKVYVAKLELLSAQQELNDKLGKGSSISLSASAGPELEFKTGKGYQSTSVDLAAGIGVKSGNFAVNASVGNTWDTNGWGNTMVSFSGSYSGGNKNTVEINKLESNVYSKQLAYDTAVFNYNTSAKTVEDNIQKALVAYDQLEIRKDYNNRILDYTTTLYENGFTTAKALEDARFEVESDSVDELLLNLTALQLECDIKILAL